MVQEVLSMNKIIIWAVMFFKSTFSDKQEKMTYDVMIIYLERYSYKHGQLN